MNAITILVCDNNEFNHQIPGGVICRFVADHQDEFVWNQRTHETIRDLMLAGF